MMFYFQLEFIFTIIRMPILRKPWRKKRRHRPPAINFLRRI